MSRATAHENICPQCGTRVASQAPEGLCPRCVAALSLGCDTALSEADGRPAAPPLTPEELAPHFPQLEIIECFGRGGMGVVYKARQKSLNRIVALKLIAPERVTDAKFAQRFAEEAQALAALNHPNIVTVHEFGQTDGLYFLIMEFVDGVSLRQAMKAGRFTPEQALAIVPPVCEALQYAHEVGIVHRDIKPENLLLDKHGRVKIADFGIAKLLHAGQPDAALAEAPPAGTPQYMAPEQKDSGCADHRADIYSLGVVLYELLTGELPAAKLKPPSWKSPIDARLNDVVRRALQEAPELRYQSAAGLRTHVETILTSPNSGGAPSAASQAGRIGGVKSRENPPRPTRIPHRKALFAATLILLFAAGAVIIRQGHFGQPAPAMPAITDSVDFNSETLTDSFFVNVQTGSNPYSLAPRIGLGGSPGVKLHSPDASKDATLVYKTKGYDLSTLTSLEAACFVRKQALAQIPGQGPLMIGLLGANNAFLGGYDDPTTKDDAFVLVRIGVSNSGQWVLQTQSKPGDTFAVAVPSTSSAFTAKDGNWYHLRAIFQRTSASTVRVTGAVSNAAANGAIGSPVCTLGPTDISIADIAGRHQAWVGMRGFGASGAETWDNFTVRANGVKPGVPTAPTLRVRELDAYRVALSWADNSVNEDHFIVSRALTADGPFTDLVTLAANSTSYIDTTANRTLPNHYQVRAASAAGSAASSEIAVPAHQSPYRWTNAAIGGGGYVTGIFLHPTEPNLIYIRTNIGGFYRWDAANSHWLPITDHLRLANKDLYGGEGLALDRNHPDIVYVACGKYADPSRGYGVILKSSDRGGTWTKLPLTGIRMGGNEAKKTSGERLVVSPHDSNVILFGSRNDGLWRSSNAGASWARVDGFPGPGVTLIGITSVAFDPQTAGVVYAALYGEGVYRSSDDGVSWTLLGGGPMYVNRMQMDSRGALLATHQSGVSRYAAGAWKHSTPGGSASPLYGLGINPANANDVLVAEGESDSANIYRSRDGGESWAPVSRTVASSTPWHTARDRRMTVVSAIEFDPEVTGRAWVADGFGVWRTDEINASPVAFTNEEKGHEEAVVFSLAAPASGTALLSGVAGIDGFRHDRGLGAAPSQCLGIPGGRVQDSYGIAVCESDPAHMVRCVGNRTSGFNVLTSADGGVTWAFTSWSASFPRTMALRAAVSATDPANFVVISESSSAHVTTDGGATWQRVSGLPPGPYGGPYVWMQPLAADRQLGGTFYYHDGAGKVYRSTDKGLTFLRVNSVTLDAQVWTTIRTLPGAAKDVWVSLDAGGLYRSTNGGANFTKLSKVARAYLFAFGKPAPGSSTPALYLYGRINDSGDEIFRSLDLGATWTELTDSRVAMGDAPSVMEASAQTYGLVFIGTNGRGIYVGEPSKAENSLRSQVSSPR